MGQVEKVHIVPPQDVVIVMLRRSTVQYMSPQVMGTELPVTERQQASLSIGHASLPQDRLEFYHSESEGATISFPTSCENGVVIL